jgi:hypothetical protein
VESAVIGDVSHKIQVDEVDAVPKKNGNGHQLGKNRIKSAEKAQDKYKHKKAMAQGMMDLALLSSNAHQLRLILEYKEKNNYFYVSISCILLSIALQVAVAVAFILKFKVLKRYYYGEAMDEETQIKNFERKAHFDNYISLGILFITIINVFMTAFGSAQL